MQHVRRACTVVLKAFARNMSRVCSLAYICWYIWQQPWLIYLWVLCWLRGGTCEPPLRPPSSRTRPSCLINKHKDFRAGAMSITSLVFNSWLYGSCSTRQQRNSKLAVIGADQKAQVTQGEGVGLFHWWWIKLNQSVGCMHEKNDVNAYKCAHALLSPSRGGLQ